jgi:sugar phosphate isomerase/epimerase
MSTHTNRRVFLKAGALGAVASIITSQMKNVQAMAPITRPFGARMKTSVAAYSYRKYLTNTKNGGAIEPASMTIEGFLDECAKIGLGAAEPTSYYFPNPLSREFLLKFKHKAHLLGLDISGTAIGNNFVHPPGAERDKQLKYTKDWIDYSEIFGAPCIRIFAGNKPKEISTKQAIKWAIETTQIACDYAAQKGVFLALENHGGIVSKPEELVEIVKSIDSDWFGINFDSGNFHTEDPYKDLKKIAPYAINAQVKVEMRTSDGKRTHADFNRIIDILGEADYRGYVALEYEASEEPKEAIPRHLEALQKAIDQAG